jgi:hypothetical protein
LVAKGAAINVEFDIVCDAPDTGIDYGFVQVHQSVGKKLIAFGEESQWTWGTWDDQLTCDGSTRNHFTQLVYPGADYTSGVAFKSGVALVRVYANAGPWPTFTDVSVEMRVKKAK